MGSLTLTAIFGSPMREPKITNITAITAELRNLPKCTSSN